MTEEQLRALLEDDDIGLLDVKRQQSPATNEQERLLDSFDEIQNFVDQNMRTPNKQCAEMNERRLAVRLAKFRLKESEKELLKPFDRHELLAEIEVTSIDDILTDDIAGILGDDIDDIFDTSALPQLRNDTEYVARKKTCPDFDSFELLFKQCQLDLKEGKRKLLPFTNTGSVKQGDYYALNGLMLYVAKCETDHKRKLGDRLRPDSRLRVIYENGTESDLLLRSLGKVLLKEGKRVSVHEEKFLNDEVDHNDQANGYLYVLSSKSIDPQITEIPHLHKIGYSQQEAVERIKNATSEPTYLMAEVAIISEYQCYNMNPQKLEHILHTVFGSACVDIDIFDAKGKRHTPREWFSVPFSVIEEAIILIVSEEILNYRYNTQKSALVKI
jgi:predicted DNA-binding antitoxin AbrB/MazE fold protein